MGEAWTDDGIVLGRKLVRQHQGKLGVQGVGCKGTPRPRRGLQAIHARLYQAMWEGCMALA